MTQDSEVRALADIYVSTHVTVEVEGSWVSASEAVHLIEQPLHVITAWNPALRE